MPTGCPSAKDQIPSARFHWAGLVGWVMGWFVGLWVGWVGFAIDGEIGGVFCHGFDTF